MHISQKVKGVLLSNLQDNIFIWRWRYWHNFKSALVYLLTLNRFNFNIISREKWFFFIQILKQYGEGCCYQKREWYIPSHWGRYLSSTGNLCCLFGYDAVSDASVSNGVFISNSSVDIKWYKYYFKFPRWYLQVKWLPVEIHNTSWLLNRVRSKVFLNEIFSRFESISSQYYLLLQG